MPEFRCDQRQVEARHQLFPRLLLVQDDVEPCPLGDLDEIVGPQAVLVLQIVVPPAPLRFVETQVVRLVQLAVEVRIVIAAVHAVHGQAARP